MWSYDGETQALDLEDEWMSLCLERDMSRAFVSILGIRRAGVNTSKVEDRCELVEC